MFRVWVQELGFREGKEGKEGEGKEGKGCRVWGVVLCGCKGAYCCAQGFRAVSGAPECDSGRE